jgi:DNA-binding transcriptional MocR family regulator
MPRLAPGVRLKWQALVEALAADIGAGLLAPGMRLPPHRAIAAALDLDITTVTRAFNEAHRRGLVAARAGRGTFVRGAAESPDIATMVDLSLNMPPQPAAARLATRLPAGFAEVLGASGGLARLHYQDSAGAEADRLAGTQWLEERFGPLPAERIVVASGAQSALVAICDLLPGTGGICTGAVTYPGLIAVARRRGLPLHPLAMDADGILPDAFAASCRVARPQALYLVPNIDNPTTATLPEARRHALADIARQHGVAIIEDDPYASLLEDAPPPVAMLAPELTWHVSTLSKCVTPALRIAYVVCPGEPEAVQLAAGLRSTTLMAPPINAALATRWIADGTLAEIAGHIRTENIRRQTVASQALAGAAFASCQTGHHLWLRLPAPWRAPDFAAQAGRLGLAIVPGDAFAAGGPAPDAVRISLGVAPDSAVLGEAVRRLSGLLARPPSDRRAVV